MFRIYRASEGDIQIACNIMKEAAEWLTHKGMPLWNPEDLTPERVLTNPREEELFLTDVESEPAGTIILQEKDEFFWPEINDGSSLFFHKLTVRRKFAGLGVSAALIDYAYKVAKSRNKTHLRMD